MSSSTQLVSGSGAILYLNFLVKDSAVYGAMSAITLSRKDFGNQYGKDLSWFSGITVSNGVMVPVMSKVADSDGDGLTDYEEQMADGVSSYSPWNASSNSLGGDTDTLNPDSDGDGYLDGAEKIAGTSPFDKFDLLSITNVDLMARNGFKVHWHAKAGKRYSIEYSTNLTDGFLPLETNRPGSGSDDTFTDTNSVNYDFRYYRIRVKN
jgi:hypothetical protein